VQAFIDSQYTTELKSLAFTRWQHWYVCMGSL